MRIKIIKTEEWNWYKDLLNEVLEVKDMNKYEGIGVQIYRPDGENNRPDVIQNGHYELIA